MDLMDHYLFPLSPAHPGLSRKKPAYQQNWLVLVACMHAGAKVVRITHDERGGWKIILEASFRKGHETLVYACAFRREWTGDGGFTPRMSPKAKKVLGIGIETDSSSVQTRSDRGSEGSVSPSKEGKATKDGRATKEGKAAKEIKTAGNFKSKTKTKNMKIMINGNGNGNGSRSGEKAELVTPPLTPGVGRYEIISTSFYDRKICNWKWKDERRGDAVC